MRPLFVGITQRVVTVPHRAEIGDYLDHRWAQRLADHKLTALPLPNHLQAMRSVLRAVPIRLLILSGGNDLAALPGATDAHPRRDEAELAAIEYARDREIPVLGICRGAQLLAARLGVQLHRRPGHAGTVHGIRTFSTAPSAWAWPPRFEVASHHDWVIPRHPLPAEIEVLAEADDGTVEAFTHPAERQWGLMWHPEREAPGGFANRTLRHIIGGL